jgi:hypothetical protein
MTQWRPIKTAPRDRFVLLHVPNGQLESGPVTMGIWFPCEEEREATGRFKKQHPWWPADWQGWLGTDADNSSSWCEPTHWMEMPAPPVMSDERGGEA